MENVNFNTQTKGQVNTTNTKRESLLQVEEHDVFNPVMESELSTSREIMYKINSLFQPIFDDYKGCTVVPAIAGSLGAAPAPGVPANLGFDPHAFNVNGWDVKLYFARSNQMRDGDVCAFDFFSAKEANTSSAGLNNLFRMSSIGKATKLYEIGEDGKCTLKDLFHPSAINKKTGEPNWKQFITEGQAAPNAPVQAIVCGIDIIKLIQLIYGDRDAQTGDPIQYQVIPMSPVSNGNISNWKVQIARVNMKGIRKAEKDFGIMSANPACMPMCPVR